MVKKLRVGLLGGSFNPPHNGHLHISRESIKRLNLNQLWWIVSPQNPLKSDNIKDSFEERIKLCEDISENDPKILVSDIEKKLFPNNRKFYTYNLLKRLNEKFKDHEFFLILGADNLASFHKWYNYEKIPELANIVVFNRPGYKQKALNSISAKKKLYSEFFDIKTKDISSTEIRKKKK